MAQASSATGPLLERRGAGIVVPGPAVGLLEVRSIARGLVLTDAVVKRAPVQLCLSQPVSPGKFLTLFSGGVAEVEESYAAGLALAAETLCDRLLLPQVHDDVRAALSGAQAQAAVRAQAAQAGHAAGALGIIETFSAAAALLAADAACKAANVALHSLRLCDGLGGKGYFVLYGEQADVEAALQAAERVASPGLLLARELIARPHAELLHALA